MDKYTTIAHLLAEVETQLRVLQLWDESPPEPAALSSCEPFCVDTLAFYQWLQFVFLPRMQQLLEQGGALPENCQIKPMVETYLADKQGEGHRLIEIFEQIDRLLS